METVICIVRHGQTDRNKAKIIQGRGNFDLNEVGRNQAQQTANYFLTIKEHFDVICSSPLNRAKDTATIIAKTLNYDKEIKIIPEFIEREFGNADGCNIEPNIYDKIIHDDVEGMEKSYEIQQRLINAVKSLAKEYPGKRILVASHSHAIKGLLTGIDKSRSFLDQLNNCAINYFIVKDDNIIIDKVNISVIQE